MSVVIGAATFMLTSVPAGAKPAAPPQAQVKLNNLKVLDGDGHPFPGRSRRRLLRRNGTRARRQRRIRTATSIPSSSIRTSNTASLGFATNTGWSCGGYPLNDKLWWFGPTSNGLGRTFPRAQRPSSSRGSNCTGTATVLNGEQRGPRFPAGTGGGVMACTASSCLFVGMDANGVVQLHNWADNQGVVQMADLDPNAEHQFTAWVTNPAGWDTSCAYYTPTAGSRTSFSLRQRHRSSVRRERHPVHHLQADGLPLNSNKLPGAWVQHHR